MDSGGSAFVATSACGRACLQVGTAAFIVDASHGFCFCCRVGVWACMSPGGDCRFHCWRVTWILLLLPSRRVGVHVSRWGLPLSLLTRHMDSAFVATSGVWACMSPGGDCRFHCWRVGLWACMSPGGDCRFHHGFWGLCVHVSRWRLSHFFIVGTHDMRFLG